MDPRPRVAHKGKALNLVQLAAELGAALAADDVDVVVVDDSRTQAQLQAAVDAHVAQPTSSDRAADLRAKALAALDANATYLALANPSNAKVLEQVARLTQQNNMLIRLVLGRLDTTEGT